MFHLSPGWSGLHSFVVPFPIIFLLVAPVLVIVGARATAAKRQVFLGSALTLMVLGTGMTYLAFATGKLAMKGIVPTPGLSDLLNDHWSLAESTLELFSGLTLGFAALLFFSKLLGRDLESGVRTALFSAFLVFYGIGAVLLIDTTLRGGHVAHVLGAKTAVTCNLPNKEGR
jgi:uncharacterized membrane protein